MEKRKSAALEKQTTFKDLEEEEDEKEYDLGYLEKHKTEGRILTKVMFLDPSDYYRSIG